MKKGKIKFFIAFVGLIMLASYSPKLISSVEDDPCVVNIVNNNGISIGYAYVYRDSNGIVTIKEATSSYPFPAEFYPTPIYEGPRQDNDVYDVITRQGDGGNVNFPFTGERKVYCSESGRALESDDAGDVGVGGNGERPTSQPTTRPVDSDGDGCLDGQILCEKLGISQNGRKDLPAPFEICCPLASGEKAERGACNYNFGGFPFCDFECPNTHETCRVGNFRGFACCDNRFNRCVRDIVTGPYCGEIPCDEITDKEACQLNTKCEVIPCDENNQITGRFTAPIGNAFGCTLFGQDLGFDLPEWLGGGNGGEEEFCGCRTKQVQCSDGRDNEDPEDQVADGDDPGCYDSGRYDPDDDDETDTLPECSDNFDNDGDGDIDCQDGGCYSILSSDPFLAGCNPDDDNEDNLCDIRFEISCGTYHPSNSWNLPRENDGSVDIERLAGLLRSNKVQKNSPSGEITYCCSRDVGCENPSNMYPMGRCGVSEERPTEQEDSQKKCPDGMEKTASGKCKCKSREQRACTNDAGDKWCCNKLDGSCGDEKGECHLTWWWYDPGHRTRLQDEV